MRAMCSSIRVRLINWPTNRWSKRRRRRQMKANHHPERTEESFSSASLRRCWQKWWRDSRDEMLKTDLGSRGCTLVVRGPDAGERYPTCTWWRRVDCHLTTKCLTTAEQPDNALPIRHSATTELEPPMLQWWSNTRYLPFTGHAVSVLSMLCIVQYKGLNPILIQYKGLNPILVQYKGLTLILV